MAGKSKPLTIVTDREPEKWEQFILDCITNTQGQIDDEESGGLRGMYFAAIMHDSRVLSGYETLEPLDLGTVAATAMLDAVDLYMEQNFERFYAQMMTGIDDDEDADDREEES